MADDIENVALDDFGDGDQRRLLGIGLDVVGAAGARQQHAVGHHLLNGRRGAAPALDLNIEPLLGEESAGVGIHGFGKADDVTEGRQVFDLGRGLRESRTGNQCRCTRDKRAAVHAVHADLLPFVSSALTSV